MHGAPPTLVNCPTRWSLLFIFGFLYWSSSWRWQPHIGVCRLLWPLLRAGMAVLTQFFCKMYFLYVSQSRKKNVSNFFLVLPPETAVFFGRGPDFQGGGSAGTGTPSLEKLRKVNYWKHFYGGWYQSQQMDQSPWNDQNHERWYYWSKKQWIFDAVLSFNGGC